MYIWEVDILDLPFGWQELFEREKVENPFGKFVGLEHLKDDTEKLVFFDAMDKGCTYYNPYEYKKKLISVFNQYTRELKKMINEESNDLSRIFTVEFLLWGMVWDYTRMPLDDINNYLMYDTKIFNSELTLWQTYCDYDDYFNHDYIEVEGLKEPIEKLITIKLVGGEKEHTYVPHSPNISVE